MSESVCSHGPGCRLPWSVHDWSYEADQGYELPDEFMPYFTATPLPPTVTDLLHANEDRPLRPGDNPLADQLIEENDRLRHERNEALYEIDRLKAALYKIAEEAEVAHQGGLHNV